MENQVIVRFAPSPTGYLHIGGARTAIFNWLYARQNKGKFILRIEDTDAERAAENAIQGIMDSMSWLGLDWDQGPDFQSRSIDAHLKAARTLLETGRAYKCFCTREAIEQERARARANKETYTYGGRCRNLTPEQIADNEAKGLPCAIRLKVPRTGSLKFTDAVYGSIEKSCQDIEDFVIVRSNGKPLYILSNAVDDIRDRVTHVIRGQDGLANTPKQILIYNALGAPLPVFAHMSLTLDPSKAKISKRRHGEMVAIHYYREKGFLPWAFVNFLVLLGWATPESREIFSREDLISAFSLDGISRGNSIFNILPNDRKFPTDPKALSINAHYLRTMDMDGLMDQVKPLMEKEGLWRAEYETGLKDRIRQTIDLLRSRFHLLTDFTTLGRAYFSDEFHPDPKGMETLAAAPELKDLLPGLGEKIKAMEDFNEKELETLFKAFLAETGIKPGVLVNAVRMVLTGQTVGPDFIKSVAVLGREKTAGRLLRSGALFKA